MKTVKVIYREEPDGAWIATSPHAPGFVGHGDTLEEAHERVQDGLPFYIDEPEVLIFHIVPERPDDDNASEGPSVRLGITQPAPAPAYGHHFSAAT